MSNDFKEKSVDGQLNELLLMDFGTEPEAADASGSSKATSSDHERIERLKAITEKGQQQARESEKHNAKRLHTRSKRPYRKVGFTIDEWRKTEEGKAVRNPKQREAYANMIAVTEQRAVRGYNPNPTAEDRKAQQRAASKRYRDKQKAMKEARKAAEEAEGQAKIAARAIF